MLTFGIYAQLYHLCKANFAGIVLSYRYEFEVTVASAGGFSVFSFMTVHNKIANNYLLHS